MNFPRRDFLRFGATTWPRPPVAIRFRASGAAWPKRVVRIMVGFPPGGGADSAARIAANRLSEMWGQQVVVENKAGAGGNIANDTVAHAAPDGYTILFSPSSLPMMPMLFTSLNSIRWRDLAPISLLGKYPEPHRGLELLPVPIRSKDYIAAPRPIPARSPTRRPASARRRISPPSCSRRRPGLDILTCPIAESPPAR